MISAEFPARHPAKCKPRRNGRGLLDLHCRKQLLVASEPHHCTLQLFESANLDLAHAFAADAIDLAQFFQGFGIFRQAAFGQNMLFAFRSEEHTSELQSLMRISYAVFCLKKKKRKTSYIT